MKYVNYNNKEFNIIHFQGKCKRERADVFNEIYKEHYDINPINDITVLTVFTDDIESKLYQQMLHNNIPVINGYINNHKPWVNQYKIKCITDGLYNIDTKYTLILDGSDTLVLSFDNMIEKFNNTGYDILFNATKNRWPNIEIDSLQCRPLLGEYKYLNAGACIGYTDELYKFYNDALKYYDIENPVNSEQAILRYKFAEYSISPLQKKLFFDYKCDIFQTVGASTLEYQGNNVVKIY